MSLKRGLDLVYTIRFLHLLVTPWEKTDAYKLGIIDSDGNPLKKVRDLNQEEIDVYTSFHRLVYNVKRLILKIPIIGKTILLNYAAAIYLIKEQSGMNDVEIEEIIITACESLGIKYKKYFDDIDFTNILIESCSWILNDNGELVPGEYKLNKSIVSPITGELIGNQQDIVVVKEFVIPYGFIYNIPIYKVTHKNTYHSLLVSVGDIERK
jgi:hypothetical protein